MKFVYNDGGCGRRATLLFCGRAERVKTLRTRSHGANNRA